MKQIPAEVPLVTVGICTLNSQSTIADTLKSVLNLIYPANKLQVVIVDGKSKDDTLKIAKEILTQSKVRWQIATDGGRGLGYARQLIVELSEGTYLTFVDSDQSLHPAFLHSAIEHLKTYSEVAAVRGIQGLTLNLPLSGALENYAMSINEHATQLEIGVMTFALGGSVLKKDAIVDAGGFREMFRFASEDTDLAERLSRLGYKIHSLQSAIFYHNSRHSWRALFRQYRTWGRCRTTFEKAYNKKNLRMQTLMLNFSDISFGTVIASRDIVKAYKDTKDIRCVLLPLNFLFKRFSWTIGYLF